MAEDDQIAAVEAQLALERQRTWRLEAQVRNLADHDPVTDLLNASSFERELDGHVARCARYGPEGALLLIGLEGLDHITTALGQRAADEAIASVADALVSRLRATDVLGRCGPDELAVLIPKEASDVAVLAAAVVKIVDQAGTAQVEPGSLAASIGVAPVVATPVGAAQLLGRARQAMAAARHRGGGRSAVAG